MKIYRIKQAYLHYLRLKEEKIEIILKKDLRIFSCIMVLKSKKFLIYRSTQLEKIKEKLSILIIKKYYHSNQLTIYLLIKRIKKYKRKLRIENSSSVQNDKSADGHLIKEYTATHSGMVTNHSSEENLKNNENLGNILECASLTSTEFLQIEEIRRQKIQHGRISYNIPKAKEHTVVLPYLYQKDMIEDIRPSNHYITTTSAVVSRMMNSNPKRQHPLKKKIHLTQNTQITTNSPKELPKKIIFDKEHLPNFTRPTLSSSVDTKTDDEPEKNKKIKLKLKENSNLLKQTFAGIQRITQSNNNKRSTSVRKETYTVLTPKHSIDLRYENISRTNKYRAQTTMEIDRNYRVQLPCLVPLASPFANTIQTRVDISKTIG